METHRKTGSTSLTYQSLAHKHSPMTLKHKDIVSQIFTFIDRVLFIEKKTKVKFENVTLYPSEIHLILFLYREQDTNVTRIAERLGVTKGAISQTLSRLESKGVLHKVKDPNNKNELQAEFLPFGLTVLDHCLNITANIHTQYDDYLASLTENERETISKFVAHIDGVMRDEVETKE
ncbi:MAG TPA: hypothetical protein DEB70_06725 [Planctomycetaceae bacterium]|nr:hypothetical protein [Planctomycetaceae bacterium]